MSTRATISDIAANAETALGDSDILGLISEGLRRGERVEFVRSGALPKHKRVHAYEVVHDLNTLMWCGLTAVACLTGATTSEVRELVRDYREDPVSRVDGTIDDEVRYAFEQLGYDARLVYFCHAPLYKGHPTLARWLQEFPREPHVGYLIGMRGSGKQAGHWATILGDHYNCARSKGLWVHKSVAPNRRSRIQSAYAITKR